MQQLNDMQVAELATLLDNLKDELAKRGLLKPTHCGWLGQIVYSLKLRDLRETGR